MIEYPEAVTLAAQLKETVSGKSVKYVLPPKKPHKFCWFCGDAADYEKKIINSSITGADAFGIYAEIGFDNGLRLCINDGVNVRLVFENSIPGNYQLVIGLSDGTALVFSVAMYGGIVLHDGGYDNEYYLKSRYFVSPFDASFRAHFDAVLSASKPGLSAKALLATGQRFPGIGNGVSQDILFAAGINPKRKLGTMDKDDIESLYSSIVSTLREMTEMGGRNTEKNIYGIPGGYETKMSKTAFSSGCPVCGGAITKENYLGGSVYYCPHCQPK